jgi:hypothetical protein
VRCAAGPGATGCNAARRTIAQHCAAWVPGLTRCGRVRVDATRDRDLTMKHDTDSTVQHAADNAVQHAADNAVRHALSRGGKKRAALGRQHEPAAGHAVCAPRCALAEIVVDGLCAGAPPVTADLRCALIRYDNRELRPSALTEACSLTGVKVRCGRVPG